MNQKQQQRAMILDELEWQGMLVNDLNRELAQESIPSVKKDLRRSISKVLKEKQNLVTQLQKLH